MPNETIHVFDQFTISVEPGTTQRVVMNGEGPKLDEDGNPVLEEVKLVLFTYALDDRREIYRFVAEDDKREAMIEILANGMTPARKKKVAALLTPTARKTNRKRD